MLDQSGRRIEYLRISLLDSCNLFCSYCREEGKGTEHMLKEEEVLEIVKAASKQGIRHIRLTGGEPLLYPGIASLIFRLKEIEGIESVALTTNGVLLKEQAEELKKAGLDRLNVSLDTLDEDVYERITGRRLLGKVLEGIDAALEAGLFVKLNCVLGEETDAAAVTGLAESRKVTVRFIERMPFGKSGVGEMSCRRLLDKLEEAYGKAEEAEACLGMGPARYFRFPRLQVPVGIIAPIHEKFCSSCTRLRVTSDGKLRLCLGREAALDLKDGNYEEILREGIEKKPFCHGFEEGRMDTSMNEIGG